jgi:hypothetical protein
MLEKTKEALRARIQPTSTHLAALRGDLRNRLQHFKANRAPEEQDAMEKDFARVLQAWGIEDATHIPYVLAELRLRLPIFALPLLGCSAALMVSHSTIVWLAVVLIVVPCCLWAVYHLLASIRAFPPPLQSFPSWLCSVVGLAQKGA